MSTSRLNLVKEVAACSESTARSLLQGANIVLRRYIQVLIYRPRTSGSSLKETVACPHNITEQQHFVMDCDIEKIKESSRPRLVQFDTAAYK